MTVDSTILAHVPSEHLESGEHVCRTEGKVAFGSMAFEFFKKVDTKRSQARVPVLIYPSHENETAKVGCRVCWTAEDTGSVRSDRGVHPEGMRFRPPTTANYAGDKQWAIYWHVENLRRLPDDETRAIGELRAYRGRSRTNTPPRGPQLIELPSGFNVAP